MADAPPKGGVRPRCAIYARVSTEKQAEHNISLPDQLARARVFAETKGWDVVAEFVEAGGSGRDESKRPQFVQMISEALSDRHPFDFIVVHSISRFYRDQAKFELLRRQLSKVRVQLKSLTQDVNEDSAGGAMTLNIMALMDEYTSRENSKHVRRTMEANAREGFRNGGVTPHGYSLVVAEERGARAKRKLAINPDEAPLVVKVFGLHQQGLGISTITTRINDEGYRTRRGNKWYKSAIASMLTNETYVGRSYFKGSDPITGQTKPRSDWVIVPCPAIIPELTFQQVQEQLALRAPNVTAPRITTSAVLLGGIARCASCGRNLQLTTGTSGTNGKVYRYYKCAGKVGEGACAGGRPIIIPESTLDQIVLDSLTEHLMTPERVRSVIDEVYKLRSETREQASDRVKQLKRQLSRLQGQEKNLWEIAANLGLKAETGFREKLDAIELEKDQVSRNLLAQEELLGSVVQPISEERSIEISSKLREMVTHIDAAVTRRFVHSLVLRVDVDENQVSIFGQTATLAEVASGSNISADFAAAGVRASDREWRTQEDSNLWPLPSEGSALSS